MYYAGIGSRKTPEEVLYWMEEISDYMSKFDWTLRSGGAVGADSAFEKMATKKEIFIPWNNFNGHKDGILMKEDARATAIAQKVWDNRYRNANVSVPWNSLREPTKLLMTRNCYQILGRTLSNPSKLVICWTPDGEASGDTGQALWLAKMVNESTKVNYRIKVLNLKKQAHREAMRNAMKTNLDPLKLWSYDIDSKKGV